jgi:hypothetical protein
MPQMKAVVVVLVEVVTVEVVTVVVVWAGEVPTSTSMPSKSAHTESAVTPARPRLIFIPSSPFGMKHKKAIMPCPRCRTQHHL